MLIFIHVNSRLKVSDFGNGTVLKFFLNEFYRSSVILCELFGQEAERKVLGDQLTKI